MLIPADVQELIDIYIKAQENLVKTIAEKEAKGNVTSYQKSLLKQVLQILQNLDDQAKNWSNEVIPDYYQQGINDAIKGLKDLNQDISSVNFSQIHQGAIGAIINNCYGDLHDANNFIGRQIQDTIRQAGIDEVTQKFAQGLTVKECKNNIINKLVSEGINGIKDKRGRNISLDAYASTVARSTTREATNTATTNQLTGLGYDLVKMSSHLTSCPLCVTYQGRVYSISGKSTEYPPLDTAFSGEYANIHPNCRHVLMPYIPALADDPEGDKEYSNRSFDISKVNKKTIDKYNKQQKEKRQLREDRNQYQKYKLTMPNNTPNSFANFRQMKNANSDKFQSLQNEYKSTRIKNINIGNAKGAARPICNINDLSKNELYVIEGYKTFGNAINQYIRKRPGLNIDESAGEYVPKLETILKKTHIPQQITTYRGVSANCLEYYKDIIMKDPARLIGVEISDKAFMSTSKDLDVAKRFTTSDKLLIGKDIILEIKVPKGYNSLELGEQSLNLENEVLLINKTKIRITGVDDTRNVLTDVMKEVDDLTKPIGEESIFGQDYEKKLIPTGEKKRLGYIKLIGEVIV